MSNSTVKVTPLNSTINITPIKAYGVLTVPVFLFDDLTEDVQAKVLENHCNINLEIEGWDEQVLEEQKEKLKAFGFSGVAIAYTGFWSQGDGASFTAESIDAAKFIRATRLEKNLKFILNQLEDGTIITENGVERINHQYCHANTVRVNLAFVPIDEEPLHAREADDLLFFIESHVKKLCVEIYESLQKTYEDLQNEEQITETIKANEMLFTEDGQRQINLGVA